MLSEEHHEILIKFGKHLQALRIKQKLSLRKLALNCNIDHADIKKYENGDYNMTLISLTELAKGLGVPLKELIDY